jgi:hypothetical protein
MAMPDAVLKQGARQCRAEESLKVFCIISSARTQAGIQNSRVIGYLAFWLAILITWKSIYLPALAMSQVEQLPPRQHLQLVGSQNKCRNRVSTFAWYAMLASGSRGCRVQSSAPLTAVLLLDTRCVSGQWQLPIRAVFSSVSEYFSSHLTIHGSKAAAAGHISENQTSGRA